MLKIAVISVLMLNAPSFAMDFEGNSKTDIKEDFAELELPKVTKPNTVSQSIKEWTVMVFVNAKNDLESYGLKDVNEMEMVGSTDKVNIVVELGRIKGYSSLDGDWKGCRRLYIKKDNDTSKITSPILSQNEKCDMGSWEYLVDFTNWSKKNYPAKKYVLIVWNHGSGWDKGRDMMQVLNEKGISYDDETNNHITTQQLRMALNKIGWVDIFAMDACLMQMAEVSYEIKDYTKYIVASQETEPADGYTYNTLLGPLVKDPTMDAKKLSMVMVDSYTDYYASIDRGATQSSISAENLKTFAKLIDEFVDALISSNDIVNAKNARNNAQDFYYSSNKDIYHFVKLIYDSTQVNEVKLKAKSLLDFMKANLIVHNRVTGASYTNAYGLAGYLPTYYTTSYDKLMWAKETKWDDLIKWLNK